jgi:hypothetical protein
MKQIFIKWVKTPSKFAIKNYAMNTKVFSEKELLDLFVWVGYDLNSTKKTLYKVIESGWIVKRGDLCSYCDKYLKFTA